MPWKPVSHVHVLPVEARLHTSLSKQVLQGVLTAWHASDVKAWHACGRRPWRKGAWSPSLLQSESERARERESERARE